ncbi:MAG: DUF2232 domain-containing protein [Alphaproteobacteria bacterium]|nr:DUF2232 domain-containing protein [Alphaproteobacteria bacterium]
MSKEFLIAATLGVVSGVFYAALATGSPGGMVLAYLSQMPLFLAGLSAAWPIAAVGAAVAAVIVAGIGGLASTGLFLLTSAVPAVLLVRQALLNRPTAAGDLEWYPPGMLVAWLAGLPAIALAALALFAMGEEGGLEGMVLAFMTAFLKSVGTANPGGNEATVKTLVTAILPGLVGCSWMFMVIVNGVLAQGLLIGFQRNQRPAPRLGDMVLPSWLLYALAASLLIAVVGGGGLGYIARNLALMFALAFFLQGLGVVHALIARMRARATMTLVMFYVLLILLGWTALLVTLLGIVEPFVAIRARLAGRPPRREEE